MEQLDAFVVFDVVGDFCASRRDDVVVGIDLSFV
jgi:hypothetical protein